MSRQGDAVTPSRIVRSRLPDVAIPDLSVTDDAFRTAPADADRIAVIDGVDGSAWTRGALLDHIRRLLDEAKIAIGEVRSLADVAASEWGRYWTATYDVPDRQGGTYTLPGRPWKFSGAELSPPGDPALQGEHNAQVLGELGYSGAEIDRLEAAGAIVGNAAARMIANMLTTTSG